MCDHKVHSTSKRLYLNRMIIDISFLNRNDQGGPRYRVTPSWLARNGHVTCPDRPEIRTFVVVFGALVAVLMLKLHIQVHYTILMSTMGMGRPGRGGILGVEGGRCTPQAVRKFFDPVVVFVIPEPP